ncbi:MAG: DUF2852 domain-containing protein [Neomegalonema sp.]|nr:DUF2852 domain-containing protein [Neomegalonema sp.]
MQWLRQAEEWLDGYGRPGWITAMVLGFVIAGPFGLILLGYMIWSGKMGCMSKRNGCGWSRRKPRSSGNTAFDTYREETLRRLEEEQEAFTSYLDRLRRAKDQAEFDQFRAEHSRNQGNPEPA